MSNNRGRWLIAALVLTLVMTLCCTASADTTGEQTLISGTTIQSETDATVEMESGVTETEETDTSTPATFTITGAPTESTLVGTSYTYVTVATSAREYDVEWEVSCDNDSFQVTKSSTTNTDNSSTLEVSLYNKYAGEKGTVTVKAYYTGYEDQAVTATFDVHTIDKELVVNNVPDSVMLYMGESSGKLSINNYIGQAYGTHYNDNSVIGDSDAAFTYKSGVEVLTNIRCSVTDGGSTYKYVGLSYEPANVGTGTYTLTVSIPDTDYVFTKDIVLTVADISEAPTGFIINSEYFDANNVYIPELMLPEDGSSLTLQLANEAKLQYKVGETTYTCDDMDTYWFSKAGRYVKTISVHPRGANWTLKDEVTFIVKSPTEPTTDLAIVDAPTESTLIDLDSYFNIITLTTNSCEQTVDWEFSCDNDNFQLEKWSSSNGSTSATMMLRIECDTAGQTGTITVKAYYYGYEDKAAVATFDVYTVGKELEVSNIPDSVMLYMGESNGKLSLDSRGNLWCSASYNDNSAIAEPETTFTYKNGAEVLTDISCRSESVDVYYKPANVGKGTYTLTVSIPDTEYVFTKDIIFTVADVSEAPTGFIYNSEYFDENKVYIPELTMPENGDSLYLQLPDEAKFQYKMGETTYTCDDIDSYWFDKAGRNVKTISVSPNGANWTLEDDVTFIVKSPTEPTSAPVINGMPEAESTFIGSKSHAVSFELTVETPEQMVEWTVESSNPNIKFSKYTEYPSYEDDVATMNLTVWSNSESAETGTITVKAYYYGYEDQGSSASFDVHTAAKSLVLDDDSSIPDTLTLYMADSTSDKLTIRSFNYLSFDLRFSNDDPIDKIKVRFYSEDSSPALFAYVYTYADVYSNSNSNCIDVGLEPTIKGTGVYTLEAYVPGTDYSLTKDIAITVTDDVSGLPTGFNIDSEYFDENNVYKKAELVLPADGSALTLELPREVALPSYTVNGVVYSDTDDYGRNDGFSMYTQNDKVVLEFTKAGTYYYELYADGSGSDIGWELRDKLYFVVTDDSAVPDSIKITNVPTTYVSSDEAVDGIKLKIENPVRQVNWTVTCDNEDADWSEGKYIDDGGDSVLSIQPYQNYGTRTYTVTASYDGYPDISDSCTFTVKGDVLQLISEQTYYTTDKTHGIGVLVYDDDVTLTCSSDIELFKYELQEEDAHYVLECSDLLTAGTAVLTISAKASDGTVIESKTVTITVLDKPEISYVYDDCYQLINKNVLLYTGNISCDGSDSTTITLPRPYAIVNNERAEFSSFSIWSPDENAVGFDGMGNSNTIKVTFTQNGIYWIYCYYEDSDDIKIDSLRIKVVVGSTDPTEPTAAPTIEPTAEPTVEPTTEPTAIPTAEPTTEPTAVPTAEPTAEPTAAPTTEPTAVPTAEPTIKPTVKPSTKPTFSPVTPVEPVQTAVPTSAPTQAPTSAPTAILVSQKQVTTSGGSLNVRTSPETGSVIGKLPNGTNIKVLSSENGWSYIRATLSDGSTLEGYVSDAYLTDAQPTAVPTSAVTSKPGETTAPTPTATVAPSGTVATVSTSGSALRLRSEASTSSTVITRMPNGAEVTVLETMNGWSHIQYTADGKTYEGWASSDYIDSSDSPTTPTAAPTAGTTEKPTAAPTTTPTEGTAATITTSGSALRLRSEASTSSTVVTRMPNGAEVTVLETMNGWSHIQYTADGKTYEGWASSDYITVEGDEPKPTVAPTTVPVEGATATVVTAGGDRLNMRASDSTSAEVVVKIPDGAEVIVLDQGTDWSLCKYGDYTGYCSNDYLSFG